MEDFGYRLDFLAGGSANLFSESTLRFLAVLV